MVFLWLANGALATSGIDHRRWARSDGTLAHHLIGPRTGRPAATDALTTTVLAPHGAAAEVWATVSLLQGTEKALDMLEQRDLAGLLITPTGELFINPRMKEQIVWQALGLSVRVCGYTGLVTERGE